MELKNMNRLGLQCLLALSFTGLILLAKAAVDLLPFSQMRDAVSDTLDFPGMFISSLFYPEGVHTGRGSLAWVFLAIGFSVVFYFLASFLVIRAGIKVIAAVHPKP